MNENSQSTEPSRTHAEHDASSMRDDAPQSRDAQRMRQPGSASRTPDDAPSSIAAPRTRKHNGTRLLAAVVCGLVGSIAAGLIAMTVMFPDQDAPFPTDKQYDYTFGKGKGESTAFLTRAMSADGYLCFGSSELGTGAGIVPQVPSAVFGTNDYGIDLTCIGSYFEQNLWHTIAVGAYAAQNTPSKKILIIESPQWFFKNNGQAKALSTKFSYSLYRSFLDNPDIPANTKEAVRERAHALGVDEGMLDAAERATPAALLNDLAFSFYDDLSIRRELRYVIDGSPKMPDAKAHVGHAPDAQGALPGTTPGEAGATQPKDGIPDWQALLEQGRADAQASSTNNEFGFQDAFWERNGAKTAQAGEDFDHADNEYDDFRRLLQVCRATGMEPLVCILPVHGMWYDHCGVSTDTRARYYERMRSICNDEQAAYADFSSCEYERYFLFDNTHPGWVGWPRIEQAFYDFVHGRDDAFLGGAGFGEAQGLEAAGLDGQRDAAQDRQS